MGILFADLGIEATLEAYPADRRITVPATELAMEYVKRPLPNAALLGAFSALTGVVKLEHVLAAIKEKFPGSIGDANAMAARMAYDGVLQAQEVPHVRAN